MHRVGGAAVLVVGLLLGPVVFADAAPSPSPPVSCQIDPETQQCAVRASQPGSTGTPRVGRGGSSRPGCHDGTQEVPCTSSVGTWSTARRCYVRLMDPPPEPSNPMWGGRTTGAVYACVGVDGTWDWFWAPTAPVVTPAQVARQALASVTLPRPVMRRSPTEANSDHGVPYTWVNLWTWFWTDSASWQPLRARAAVGGTWAEVTVTPTRLSMSLVMVSRRWRVQARDGRGGRVTAMASRPLVGVGTGTGMSPRHR
jgi:hypothetical protein